MTDYSELKQLAEAATPGPWGYDGSYVCPARVEDGTTYVESWRAVADCSLTENTKFIAAANPAAILALIAENDRLSGECEGCPMAIAEALRIERDQLRAENERLHYAIQHNEACFRLELGESERLRSLVAECAEYLNTNSLTQISHGSILHTKMTDAMSQGEKAGG